MQFVMSSLTIWWRMRRHRPGLAAPPLYRNPPSLHARTSSRIAFVKSGESWMPSAERAWT